MKYLLYKHFMRESPLFHVGNMSTENNITRVRTERKEKELALYTRIVALSVL